LKFYCIHPQERGADREHSFEYAHLRRWNIPHRGSLGSAHAEPEQRDERVGTGPLSNSIDREQIARIYAMWAREKFPFGISD
jgi:hypothetical protein